MIQVNTRDSPAHMQSWEESNAPPEKDEAQDNVHFLIVDTVTTLPNLPGPGTLSDATQWANLSAGQAGIGIQYRRSDFVCGKEIAFFGYLLS